MTFAISQQSDKKPGLDRVFYRCFQAGLAVIYFL